MFFGGRVMRQKFAVFVTFLVGVASAGIAPAHSASAATTIYSPPVRAPISDPFRAPIGPYGPGNRGIEYATAVGQPVAAAADGTVEFAGQVALANHVVVRPGDGLRTSYSFLASISVRKGQVVRRGETIGAAGRLVHFGVRTPAGVYLNPALLFAHLVMSARLTTTDSATTVEVDNERALTDLMMARLSAQLDNSNIWDVVGNLARDVWAGLAWFVNQAVKLAGNVFDKLAMIVGFVATLAVLQAQLTANLANNFAHWLARKCTEPKVPLSGITDPGHRVVILVGGLTTSATPDGSFDSGLDALDLAALGYDPARVVRFSYKGGRTPAPTAALFRRISAAAYESADTEQSAFVSADRLADLIRQVHAADPTATIDVMGHSLGGLITQAVSTRPDIPSLGHVVLFGAPVHGAELAAIGVAIGNHPLAGQGVDAITDHTGLPHIGGAVMKDLAPGSDFITMVESNMKSAEVNHPLTVSIAAAGDLVVPAYRSHVDGAVNVVEPNIGTSAHGDLPGTAAALVDVSRAMNHQAPSCQSFVQSVVVDSVAPTLVGMLENSIGVVVAAA